MGSGDVDAAYRKLDLGTDVTLSGQSRVWLRQRYLPDPGGWRGWLMRRLAR